MSDEKVYCATCGAECMPEGCTTGYGQDREGRKHCFECCANRDRQSMIETGRIALYLTKNGGRWIVGDWTSRLTFTPYQVKHGKHNIARTRRDAHFTGPDGYVWHAVQYGEWSEIAHCRRTKTPARSTCPLVDVALEKTRAA